jgi:hypothetical protein
VAAHFIFGKNEKMSLPMDVAMVLNIGIKVIITKKKQSLVTITF